MNKKKWAIIVIFVVLILGLSFLYLHGHVATQPITDHATDKNLIEIFYLPHRPAEAIVEKVEPIIAKFPNYTVKKYDVTDPASKPKITGYNLVNHTPITIFINGKNTFTVDGKQISLFNFPKGDAFIPTFEGGWSYDDLEKILASQQQSK